MTRTKKAAKRNPKNKKGASEAHGKDELNKLGMNREFAEKYDTKKRREMLSSVPADLLKDDNEMSSSSSEDEDEYGELLTKGIDRRVKEALEAIRKKDPRIYDPGTKFFDVPSAENQKSNENSGDSSDDSDDKDMKSDDEPVAGWDTLAKAAEQNGPKLTLKDYVRESLLQHGNLSDDEDKDHENDSRPDYEHERDEILSAANGGPEKISNEFPIPDEENLKQNQYDLKDEDDDNFFTKKAKTAADIEQEQEELEKFITNRARKRSEAAGEDLLLHSYLEKETPDEKERFLRDFVIHNGWLDKNANDAPSAKDYEIEIDIPVDDHKDDDEGEDLDAFDEKVDDFEEKYNFRFEDPNGDKVILHSRHVPDSLRRQNESRKNARKARKERKKQKKAEKAEEIKQLKNVKKREIEARLFAIKEAAGDNIDVTGLDLDGDFDPDTFNEQMEKRFGDDYYSRKDPQMKLLDEYTGVVSDNRIAPEFNEDAPADIREDVNRMMDEYYNLDYEDIVAGKPMRFNYKRVEPESFNLSTEQILEMDDKELNQLVSVKYLAPYRSKRDVSKKSWHVKNELKKWKTNNHKNDTSGFENDASGVIDDAAEEDSQNLRKKRRLDAAIAKDEISVAEEPSSRKSDRSSKRKKKSRNRNEGA